MTAGRALPSKTADWAHAMDAEARPRRALPALLLRPAINLSVAELTRRRRTGRRVVAQPRQHGVPATHDFRRLLEFSVCRDGEGASADPTRRARWRPYPQQLVLGSARVQ